MVFAPLESVSGVDFDAMACHPFQRHSHFAIVDYLDSMMFSNHYRPMQNSIETCQIVLVGKSAEIVTVAMEMRVMMAPEVRLERLSMV